VGRGGVGWSALLFGLALLDTVFALGDFAFLIAVSALIALVWGPLRALLVWHVLHAPRPAEADRTSNPPVAASVAEATSTCT
jgi:hypothetical protein